MIDITMPSVNKKRINHKPGKIQTLCIPTVPGVYFIYKKLNRKGSLQLLYIGQTKNLRDRISQHINGSSHISMFKKLFHKIEWFLEESDFHRDLYERYFIHTLKPSLNSQLNKKDPYHP